MVWVTTVASLLTLAASLSLSEAKEDTVYAPQIYYPTTNVVWNVGEANYVVWNSFGIPPNTASETAVYLVYNSTLNLDQPLAQNFDLSLGVVEVQLPNNISSGEYQVDLMGTADNWSNPFTINN